MLKKEVEIGGTYKAKVSGNVVIVRILSERVRGNRTHWLATNLKTGRTVEIKSAAKLRERVSV